MALSPRWKKGIAGSCGLLLLTILPACDQERSAEEIGKQVDQTVEDLKERTKKFFDDSGPAEEAGEQLDQAVERTRNSLEKAGEKTKELVNTTRQKIGDALDGGQ